MMPHSRAPLDRSPKRNWVEEAGGLPPPLRARARAIMEESGFSLSRAIATAISQYKKEAAKGSAKAASIVAQWEALKAKNAKRMRLARVVRTSAGAKFYGRPIGSLIVRREKSQSTRAASRKRSDKMRPGIGYSETIERKGGKAVFGTASILPGHRERNARDSQLKKLSTTGVPDTKIRVNAEVDRRKAGTSYIDPKALASAKRVKPPTKWPTVPLTGDVRQDDLTLRTAWKDAFDQERPLRSEERSGITTYTSHRFQDLNDRLRRGRPLSEEDRRAIERVDSAMAVSKTEKDMVVYRGVRGGIANARPGAIVEDPAYTSTTLSMEKAQTFGWPIEIRVPAGSPAVPGRDDEYEVLLDRGAKIRVISQLPDRVVAELVK